MYFTDKHTNRKSMSWAGADFKRFAEAENKTNQSYDEAYISVFQFENGNYFVEHNELLESSDCESIMRLVTGVLLKIQNDRNTET